MRERWSTPSISRIWSKTTLTSTKYGSAVSLNSRPNCCPQEYAHLTANLCELFAATVGEDDVKLFFKYHVKETVLNRTKRKWTGTIIEVQVERNINFEWSHTKIENGCERGREAAHQAYKKIRTATSKTKNQMNC